VEEEDVSDYWVILIAREEVGYLKNEVLDRTI
jgi:hypothetical protein